MSARNSNYWTNSVSATAWFTSAIAPGHDKLAKLPGCTPKVRFWATVGEEPEMKVVLVQGVLAKLVTWRVHRGELIYKQWKRLKSLLLPQKPRTDRPAHDHRVLVDGIPWALL